MNKNQKNSVLKLLNIKQLPKIDGSSKNYQHIEGGPFFTWSQVEAIYDYLRTINYRFVPKSTKKPFMVYDIFDNSYQVEAEYDDEAKSIIMKKEDLTEDMILSVEEVNF